MNTPGERWHPVACSADLLAGHTIVPVIVDGSELALWRSAGGTVQAWADRCPHRSVRFSLGQVMGDRLACAYHGWQYEAGSGRCALIPAHPGMAPPGFITATSHPAAEVGGMVWVALNARPANEPPADAVPDGWHFCRCLPIRAGLTAVQHGLQKTAWRPVGAAWHGSLSGAAALALLLPARNGLTFCFLWTEPLSHLPGMAAVQASARQLRRQIETGTC